MRKIYLVRHGETESNAAGLEQDGTAELSDLGRAQAAVLAMRLRDIPAAALWVSDYVRTKQTIEPFLAMTDLVPQFTPLLRETKRPTQFIGTEYGSSAYLTYRTAAEEHIEDPTWHFEDEENYFDVMKRVDEFFMLVDAQEGDIIAVTHGRFITYLVSYVLLREALSPTLWRQLMRSYVTANTGVTVLGYAEDEAIWRLHTFNDIAHFAE